MYDLEPAQPSSSRRFRLRVGPRIRVIGASILGVVAGLTAAGLAEGAAMAAASPKEATPSSAPDSEERPEEAGAAAADARGEETPGGAADAAPEPKGVSEEATAETAPSSAPADADAAASPEGAAKDKEPVLSEEEEERAEEERERQEELEEEERERREELAEEEEERRERERCRIEAEKEGAPGSLLGDRCEKPAFGGYGGITVLGAQVDQKAVVLTGVEGGMLFNHRLSIGLAGYVLSSELKGPDFENDAESQLAFGYGGVVGRYQFVNKGPVYASAGLFVGGGLISLLERKNDESLDFNDENKSANGFLIVEPTVQVHANLTRWMRLGLDASYRFVHGVDYFDYKEKDFRGVSLGGHLQFGWF